MSGLPRFARNDDGTSPKKINLWEDFQAADVAPFRPATFDD